MKIILFIMGFLLWSPSRSNVRESAFFVENDNARMPVIIRGNVGGNVLIDFIHGGPGGTSMKKMGTSMLGMRFGHSLSVKSEN